MSLQKHIYNGLKDSLSTKKRSYFLQLNQVQGGYIVPSKNIGYDENYFFFKTMLILHPLKAAIPKIGMSL